MTRELSDTLLQILQCPECAAPDWNTVEQDAGAIDLTCGRCGLTGALREGILWIKTSHELLEVNQERIAVSSTESVPHLGGWGERYLGPHDTEPSLAHAYLSLPYGDGTPRFSEAGYFCNVKRFAREFDFVASQLPRKGLLLDLGADATWSTARLAARGLTCVALDITDHLRLGDLYQTVYPEYARLNVDMHAPVFRGGVFDAVTAFNALHHSKHLELLAERISATLKAGGTLGFVEPYVQNASQAADFGVPQTSAGINENLYTIEQWNAAFARAGLSLVTFALSDAFSATYRKGSTAESVSSDVLRKDADGCFVNYYRAVLRAEPQRARVRAGDVVNFAVSVENRSVAAWASRGPWPVRLSYHVRCIDGDVVSMHSFDNARTNIEAFLLSGQTAWFQVPIPMHSAGLYEIEFDLVHETRSWFKDRGSATAIALCEVSSVA